MFKKHTKNSTGRENFFQRLKKKITLFSNTFSIPIIKKLSRAITFLTNFFYGKSFYLSNKSWMRSWALILKKLAMWLLFCKVPFCDVRFQKKNFWEKILNFFLLIFFTYEVNVADNCVPLLWQGNKTSN